MKKYENRCTVCSRPCEDEGDRCFECRYTCPECGTAPMGDCGGCGQIYCITCRGETCPACKADRLTWSGRYGAIPGKLLVTVPTHRVPQVDGGWMLVAQLDGRATIAGARWGKIWGEVEYRIETTYKAFPLLPGGPDWDLGTFHYLTRQGRSESRIILECLSCLPEGCRLFIAAEPGGG